MHCSMMSSLLHGTTSPFNIKKSHSVCDSDSVCVICAPNLLNLWFTSQNCVKSKAVASIKAVRSDLSYEELWAIVDKVFDKCYNDLEPVGRRLRRASNHMEWAYRERYHYNYD